MNDPVQNPRSDAEWRARLDPQQYAVCRCSATEAPFSGKYWDHHENGVYHCIGCGAALFDAAAKFDSGSGWPSYVQPVAKAGLTPMEDDSPGMRRVEVRCASCASHLGHVFPDGPRRTGLRYCINSAALDFEGHGG